MLSLIKQELGDRTILDILVIQIKDIGFNSGVSGPCTLGETVHKAILTAGKHLRSIRVLTVLKFEDLVLYQILESLVGLNTKCSFNKVKLLRVKGS